VPKAGDFVQVRAGQVVVYDGTADANVPALRLVHVAGTLTFARDKSTRLDVGLLKVQPGEEASEDGFVCSVHSTPEEISLPASPRLPAALEVGSAEEPIPAGVTATIRLVRFDGTDKESLPAIIDCGGRMDFHGAAMSRTWVKLGEPSIAGQGTLVLAEPVPGWKAGDRVIVTASGMSGYYERQQAQKHHQKDAMYGTEERLIARVDGTTLVLDQPLELPHAASDDGRCEVANLSRNVVIESADPSSAATRGHTMYHRNSSGGISYAEFRHLGKQGVLGKYPIHFHLLRDGMRGTSVLGASIWDSGNRFMAIHGTDYLLIRDCVGYQCVGHGFFLEDATEQYNVLDHNLAVQARQGKPLPKQALPFDSNEGAGFWWANGRNTFTRNVACENDRYGFRFDINNIRDRKALVDVTAPDGKEQTVDARTVPFLRFEDNESHSEGLYSFDFGDDPDRLVHGDRQHPFITRNLHAWMTHYALRPSVSYYLGEHLDLVDCIYGVYHPSYDSQVFRDVRVIRCNEEPINRGHDDESIQSGSFTYDGLRLDGCRTGRDPIIQLTCTSPSPGQSGHFRNVTVVNCKSPTNIVDLGGGPRNDKLENGVVYYFHDSTGADAVGAVSAVRGDSGQRLEPSLQPLPGAQMTKVVSIKFPSLMNDGDYRPIQSWTGPDVLAARVPDVPFPNLLDPVDDLPPATFITSVRRDGNKLRVRGVSQDNGELASVKVNGRQATIESAHAGVADWEAVLDAIGVSEVRAMATDTAGNEEKTPHIRSTRNSNGETRNTK
jgi:hypothetical protein